MTSKVEVPVEAVEAALNMIYGSESESFYDEVEAALEAAYPAILADLRAKFIFGGEAMQAAGRKYMDGGGTEGVVLAAVDAVFGPEDCGEKD